MMFRIFFSSILDLIKKSSKDLVKESTLTGKPISKNTIFVFNLCINYILIFSSIFKFSFDKLLINLEFNRESISRYFFYYRTAHSTTTYLKLVYHKRLKKNNFNKDHYPLTNKIFKTYKQIKLFNMTHSIHLGDFRYQLIFINFLNGLVVLYKINFGSVVNRKRFKEKIDEIEYLDCRMNLGFLTHHSLFLFNYFANAYVWIFSVEPKTISYFKSLNSALNINCYLLKKHFDNCNIFLSTSQGILIVKNLNLTKPLFLKKCHIESFLLYCDVKSNQFLVTLDGACKFKIWKCSKKVPCLTLLFTSSNSCNFVYHKKKYTVELFFRITYCNEIFKLNYASKNKGCVLDNNYYKMRISKPKVLYNKEIKSLLLIPTFKSTNDNLIIAYKYTNELYMYKKERFFKRVQFIGNNIKIVRTKTFLICKLLLHIKRSFLLLSTNYNTLVKFNLDSNTIEKIYYPTNRIIKCLDYQRLTYIKIFLTKGYTCLVSITYNGILFFWNFSSAKCNAVINLRTGFSNFTFLKKKSILACFDLTGKIVLISTKLKKVAFLAYKFSQMLEYMKEDKSVNLLILSINCYLKVFQGIIGSSENIYLLNLKEINILDKNLEFQVSQRINKFINIKTKTFKEFSEEQYNFLKYIGYQSSQNQRKNYPGLKSNNNPQALIHLMIIKNIVDIDMYENAIRYLDYKFLEKKFQFVSLITCCFRQTNNTDIMTFMNYLFLKKYYFFFCTSLLKVSPYLLINFILYYLFILKANLSLSKRLQKLAYFLKFQINIRAPGLLIAFSSIVYRTYAVLNATFSMKKMFYIMSLKLFTIHFFYETKNNLYLRLCNNN